MKWVTAKKTQRCRPLGGLPDNFHNDPGACAPGFMLTPASQALPCFWSTPERSPVASTYQLQQKMLTRIRASLGHTARRPEPERLPAFHIQTPAVDSQSLIVEFESENEKVGGNVAHVHSREQVTAFLQSLLATGDESPVSISDGFLIEELRLREWLLEHRTRVVTWPESTSIEAYKRKLLQCGIGVTCADYALADTGTVVLLSGREHHRLASLLPPVHVCLLPTERILPNLTSLLDHISDESYSRERPPHALTCITGPSRTADIEQTITTGVHGPKALHVLLYSAETSQS